MKLLIRLLSTMLFVCLLLQNSLSFGYRVQRCNNDECYEEDRGFLGTGLFSGGSRTYYSNKSGKSYKKGKKDQKREDMRKNRQKQNKQGKQKMKKQHMKNKSKKYKKQGSRDR